MTEPCTSGRGPRWGKVGAAFGLVAFAAFAWIWALSSTSFDPPGWLRIAGSAFLPVGLGGAAVAAVLACRAGERPWALVGIGMATVSIVGLVVLATIYE